MYANAHLIASMKAAQTGDGEFASIARQMRDALADKLTPEQIAAAQRHTDEIREKRTIASEVG